VAAAKLASCSDSLVQVESGVSELRQLLMDEQRRLRSDGAGVVEGNDALLLRLTLVRALLRCLRPAEAMREAEVARRLHDAGAAALWHGRCLLRCGHREAGLRGIAAVRPAEGQMAAWAFHESQRHLNAMKAGKSLQKRAQDAYSRGKFPEAAALYGEALCCSDIVDDKAHRAELLASRAACRRRIGEFLKAIEDLDAALALFPRYPRAIFRRAVCLLEAGDAAKAILGFELVLALDRSWLNILEWLVRAHAQKRRGPSKSFGFGETAYPDMRERGQWGQAAEEKDIASEKDLYKVLGVNGDATDKQLKRAYRIMSLKFHPDKEGGSTRAFQHIHHAYETLSDTTKRRNYDEGGDLKGPGGNDSDSDNERQQSLREEVERKYFPDRYKFWPFGDPFVQKRKREERKRRRSGRPAWHEQDV